MSFSFRTRARQTIGLPFKYLVLVEFHHGKSVHSISFILNRTEIENPKTEQPILTESN